MLVPRIDLTTFKLNPCCTPTWIERWNKRNARFTIDSMLRLKHLSCGVSFFLCMLFDSAATIGGEFAPLHLKVEASELVLIGTVDNVRLLTDSESREVCPNVYSVAIIREGAIYRIKVDDILLDRRKAKEKLSHVVVYAPHLLTGAREGEENLVFLKQSNIDAAIVRRHELKSKNTYEFVFSRQGLGTLQLGSKEISSKCPENWLIKVLDKNRQYAEATKVFCGVMKIQFPRRLPLLKALLDNPLLRESALIEIGRIQNPRAYEQRYEIWRNEYKCLD